MLKKIVASFAFVLLAISFVKADVPPPSGYTRVSVPLVFETKEDLSGYRLFVNFAGICEEVIITEGKMFFVTEGGGARFSSGKLIAIPKNDVTQFGTDLTWEQKREIGNLVRENNINGVIDLGTHSFTKEVKKGKKAAIPLYVIKKDNNVLKLSLKTSPKSKKKVALSENGIDEVELAENETETENTGIVNNTAIAGFFMASSIFLGGIFFLRRKKQV